MVCVSVCVCQCGVCATVCVCGGCVRVCVCVCVCGVVSWCFKPSQPQRITSVWCGVNLSDTDPTQILTLTQYILMCLHDLSLSVLHCNAVCVASFCRFAMPQSLPGARCPNIYLRLIPAHDRFRSLRRLTVIVCKVTTALIQ